MHCGIPGGKEEYRTIMAKLRVFEQMIILKKYSSFKTLLKHLGFNLEILER